MKKENQTLPEQSSNPIKKECERYAKAIKEIQDAVEDVKLGNIKDFGEKLDLTLKKVSIMDKLPKLLLAYKQLIEESARMTAEVRGQQELSELETGEILSW